MAEVPLPTPTDNDVPSTDIRDAVYAGAMLDKVVTSTELKYTDRLGGEHYTVDGMKAEGDKVVEDTRKNLIPLSRQYMTLADAQADIANIPVGSTTYYRSPDDSALAIEVINNSGTLEPTGRKMPSQEYLQQLISSVLLELYNTNDNVFEALSDLKKLLLDNESETVLLIDREGRKLIVADHAGKVIKAYGAEMLSSGSLNTTLQPKFSDQYQYASTDQTEQVLQVDSAGRKLLVLDHANLQLKAYGKPVGANSPYISPTKDFTIIGDSLSVGTVNGATAWRTTLAGLLPGRTFNLEAISGQNSSMIAPRIGAQPPQVTVDGNSIPASGSVNVTACQILSSTG
ncbi:hypothetical protein ACSPOQ_003441, partial [Klebsiella pneumoniae]